MDRKLLMLDLCSGLGGASAAMRERSDRWDVITVDSDPRFAPDVVADVRQWLWDGPRPDLVWASPPCVEFSRESMPWCARGVVPDMSIVSACVHIARVCSARFWLLENVRGAIRWFKPTLGEPRYRMAPIYLWGAGPVAFQPSGVKLFKKQHTGGRADLKAMIPWHVSLALARAVEGDRGDRRRPSRGASRRGPAAPTPGAHGRDQVDDVGDRWTSMRGAEPGAAAADAVEPSSAKESKGAGPGGERP